MRFILTIIRWLYLPGLAFVTALAFGALLSFAVPLLDILNHLQPFLFTGTFLALLTGILLFRRHRWLRWIIALAATGFLSSGVIVVPEFVSALMPRPAVSKEQRTLKVMSQNLFGINGRMDLVAAQFDIEKPDIIAFQEYFNGQWRRLHAQISADYPYYFRCGGSKRAFVAIYAKWPFELGDATSCPRDVVRRSDSLGRIEAKFDLGDGLNFSVVTTQLNWPVQISPLFDANLSLAARLEATYARQRGEFQALAQAIRSIEGPVVLAGDFNSTPWSYALRNFASQTGLIRQSRNMLTYPKLLYFHGWQPTPAILPIDQLFTSKEIEVTAIKTGEAAGSDHLPIIAEFFLKATTEKTASETE